MHISEDFLKYALGARRGAPHCVSNSGVSCRAVGLHKCGKVRVRRAIGEAEPPPEAASEERQSAPSSEATQKRKRAQSSPSANIIHMI